MITAFGVVALSFMMAMYAFERRDKRYLLGFALGCALSSVYGFISGAWPFGILEAIWCAVAIHRYHISRHAHTSSVPDLRTRSEERSPEDVVSSS